MNDTQAAKNNKFSILSTAWPKGRPTLLHCIQIICCHTSIPGMDENPTKKQFGSRISSSYMPLDLGLPFFGHTERESKPALTSVSGITQIHLFSVTDDFTASIPPPPPTHIPLHTLIPVFFSNNK